MKRIPRHTVVNSQGYRSPLVRCLLLTATIVISYSTTAAIRRERVIDTWRPLHYSVDITLDENLKRIVNARTTIEILAVKRLSLIDLDFGDLTTDNVSLNSKPIAFEHRSGKLELRLGEPAVAGTKLTVDVSYHGTPKDGLILSTDKDGKPSAVGDNWPDRVHYWIPCLDHPSAKATVTFNITAPAKDVVVANGSLGLVQTTSGGNRTWTYSEGSPIPPYCMIIAVGEFAVIKPTGSSLIPLYYYVPASDAVYAQSGFAPAATALELFSETVGPYPYEKLALILGATRFGGMENSSAIVFTSTLFDSRSAVSMSPRFHIPVGTMSVVAHEIAHQWFGDSVTESTWADLWLSEGFATYFAGLFIQRNDGEVAFQTYMQQQAEIALAYEKKTRTPIVDRDTEDLFKLLNPNNYQKGAWVLHMLRTQLGDDAFFRGVRSYYEKHKGSTASSDDLCAALEAASGKSLRAFFSRWIYESGHPEYQLSWHWRGNRRLLSVSLKQLQTGNAFLDPVPIAITTNEGKREVVINPKGKDSFKEIQLRTKPMRIELDPNHTLLKDVVTQK